MSTLNQLRRRYNRQCYALVLPTIPNQKFYFEVNSIRIRDLPNQIHARRMSLKVMPRGTAYFRLLDIEGENAERLYKLREMVRSSQK